MMAPKLVPATPATGRPEASIALSAPMCAMPRAAPPPNATATSSEPTDGLPGAAAPADGPPRGRAEDDEADGEADDAASRSRGEADRGHGSDGPDMTHMVHRRRSADRRRRCMKRALDANTSDPPSAGARRTTAASVVQCLCRTALYQRARPVTFGEV